MLSNTGAGTGATQARARAVAPVCDVRVRHACLPTTQALKWATKLHRVRGVHVTPTVHVNGLEAGIVSSGWTGEQWLKFLEVRRVPKEGARRVRPTCQTLSPH